MTVLADANSSQIEVVLDCVLLGLGAHKAFAYAWIQGLVLLLSALLLPSIQGVFAISTIIGGGNDAFFVSHRSSV